MRISFKNVAIVSTVAALAAVGAAKYSTAVSEINESVGKTVKQFNPKRYKQIMESPNKNNYSAWAEALNEISDSLYKLNSDSAKSYFKANQIIKIK